LRGSAVGQLLLIAISPILSRLYTAAEFGVLSFYLNLFGVLAVAASMRLELAIPQAKTGDEAGRLTLLSCGSGVVLAVISIPIALVYYLLTPSNAPNAATLAYWWTIPLGIMLLAASNALTAWGTYYRLYGMVGRSRLMQSVESAAVQLSWPFLFSGPLGLILGTIVSQAGGVTRLGSRFIHRLRRRPKLLDPHLAWVTLVRYRRFPLIAATASVIGRAAVHAPGPLMLILFGPKVAGLILISQRVIGVPTIMLGRAAAVPFQQALGEAHRRNKSATRIFLATVAAFSIPGLAMVLAVMLFGPAAFGLVFGAAWREGGVYAQILAPMYFFQLLASPFTQAQSVAGRQGGQFLLETLRLAMVVGAILLAAHLTHSIAFTLIVYSATMCVVYGMYLTAAAFSARSRVDAPPTDGTLA
jgi:O-antigen/teichoic acid export membrane protein